MNRICRIYAGIRTFSLCVTVGLLALAAGCIPTDESKEPRETKPIQTREAAREDTTSAPSELPAVRTEPVTAPDGAVLTNNPRKVR